MRLITTYLKGNKNVILNQHDDGVIAILVCKGGANKDITNVVEKAIKNNYCLQDNTEIVFNSTKSLGNQEPLLVKASWKDGDNDPVHTEFELFVATTYTTLN